MYTVKEMKHGLSWAVLRPSDKTIGGTYCIATSYDADDATRIARALNRCDRLDREEAGQWVCDACEQWQEPETENVGHECDMCPACALAAIED